MKRKKGVGYTNRETEKKINMNHSQFTPYYSPLTTHKTILKNNIGKSFLMLTFAKEDKIALHFYLLLSTFN